MLNKKKRVKISEIPKVYDIPVCRYTLNTYLTLINEKLRNIHRLKVYLKNT